MIKALGNERIKKAVFTGLSTIGVKGVTVAAGLLSIPITSKYLGVERFGLWLTLSTLLTWVSVADLGLANSLTNVLASANELTERRESTRSCFKCFLANGRCCDTFRIAILPDLSYGSLG